MPDPVVQSSFEARQTFASSMGIVHTATFDAATSGRVHYGRVQGNLMYRTVCRRETAAYEHEHVEPGTECGHCRRTLDRLIEGLSRG